MLFPTDLLDACYTSRSALANNLPTRNAAMLPPFTQKQHQGCLEFATGYLHFAYCILTLCQWQILFWQWQIYFCQWQTSF
jgi:hypothetical protein